MAQYDGYVRISTQNDTSQARRDTEQLGDTIADAMDTTPVDRMSESMDGLGQSIGNTSTDGIDSVREGIDDVGSAAVTTGQLIRANLISDTVMNGVQQLSSVLKDTVVSSVGNADSLDKSVKKIIAATGESADSFERLEDVVEDIYNNNFGESFEDIANSVSKIKQNLGELDDVTLKNVTEDAYALLDVFEMGVSESSRAARALMQNFELSAEEAYDYIAKGAQDGLDYSGELLDNISEYSVQFKKMGLSADDMFNIFVMGAENGAWNLDKIGDAVKEMSIRVIDGSETTKEGFEKAGLSAENMAAKFGKGGDIARAAFIETLNAIVSIEDPLERDAAGVALLGTMWEDLGVDAVAALADLTDGAYNAAGAVEGIMETNYNGLSDTLDNLKRKFDLVIMPLGDELIPAIEEVADTVDEILDSGDVKEIAQDVGKFVSGTLSLLLKNMKLILSVTTGVTSAVIAFKAASVLTKVIASWQTAALQVKLFTMAQGAAELQTAATTGKLTLQEIAYAVLSGQLDIATAKTALLNSVMAMNPAGLIAISVGLLATALAGYGFSCNGVTEQVNELNDTVKQMNDEIDDSIAEHKAEMSMLKNKVERYDELRTAMSLTAAEQAELQGLAEELQDILGDEVTVVNTLTGEYNDLTAAVDTYIQKSTAAMKLAAYENAAKEAYIIRDKAQETLDEINQVVSSGEIIFKSTKDIWTLKDAALAAQEDIEEANRIIAEWERLASEQYVSSFINPSTTHNSAQYYEELGKATLAANEAASEALNEANNKSVEEFKKRRDDIKYQYDMGVIDAEQYYLQLAALRDKHLVENSDEWREVNVQIKQYFDNLSEEQQKAYEQQLTEQKRAAEEAAKARTTAYNDEKSQLQFKLKTNQIAEKQYYTQLAKIRDKYLDKNSSEWRNAFLETYEYNQKIIQENKDTLSQMLSDASDTTLSALESIAAARDGMAQKLIDFNKTFEKITETVPETIAVKGDFTITTSEHEVEAYRMGADSIEDNIKVLEEYGTMLDALKARGADENMLSEILDMDIDEAMEFGSGLLAMSDREWNSYFDSMAKLYQTAQDISAKYYQGEVESLRDNFIDKLRSELEGLGSDMYMVGADVAAEFVSGWNEALGTTDLTLGELMRAVSGGTLDTAPKAAQQMVYASAAAASVDGSAEKGTSIVHTPVYIGTKKVADIMVDATNGKIIQTGKNVLLT